MLILNAQDVRSALPMKETIEAMKRAYAALSAGRAEVPLRARLSIPPKNATGLFMPAFVQDEDSDSLAVKIVTLYPENPINNLPFIHAGVLVMDAETGQMQALLEGSTLTAIRTGAGSGAATDLLARRECHVAAIFGAGVQARTQLEAICAVRPVEYVKVFAPTREHVETFIEEMEEQIPAKIACAESAEEALRGADIICTATTATRPVFDDSQIKPGTHINGVGSYTLKMIEIPPQTVSRSGVFVDSYSAIMEEAGEIVAAVKQKLIDPSQLTEIGAVVMGTRNGRKSQDQITFFKSVGIAVQDAVAARLAIQNAREKGLGQSVRW